MAGEKFYRRGLISIPFQLLNGGFIGIYDLKTGWSQLNAAPEEEPGIPALAINDAPRYQRAGLQYFADDICDSPGRHQPRDLGRALSDVLSERDIRQCAHVDQRNGPVG